MEKEVYLTILFDYYGKLLTEKQLKDFLKGKDVVIYKEQFKNWKL